MAELVCRCLRQTWRISRGKELVPIRPVEVERQDVRQFLILDIRVEAPEAGAAQEVRSEVGLRVLVLVADGRLKLQQLLRTRVFVVLDFDQIQLQLHALKACQNKIGSFQRKLAVFQLLRRLMEQLDVTVNRNQHAASKPPLSFQVQASQRQPDYLLCLTRVVDQFERQLAGY